MSAHSHVTRLQMMERGRHVPYSTKNSYHNQGTQFMLSNENTRIASVISSDQNGKTKSILSGDTYNVKPRLLKQNDIHRCKSQDICIGQEDTSFCASNSMLSQNYAPSMRSLKSCGGMGHRATSRASLVSMSRSLGASKASLASQKSTIQQEYHDQKVQRKLNAPWFGVARKPFLISVTLFFISFLFLFVGLTILFLRGFGNLFLSHDFGEAVGPLFVALSILALAFGIKFLTTAYKIGARERRNIKFRGDNSNMVEVTKGPAKPRQSEVLVTGTNTKEAVTRILLASRDDLQDV